LCDDNKPLSLPTPKDVSETDPNVLVFEKLLVVDVIVVVLVPIPFHCSYASKHAGQALLMTPIAGLNSSP
jgi:hypothetical protein